MPSECATCGADSGGLSAVAAVCQVHGIAGTARGAVDGDLARGARRRWMCAASASWSACEELRDRNDGGAGPGDLHQELLRATRRSRSKFHLAGRTHHVRGGWAPVPNLAQPPVRFTGMFDRLGGSNRPKSSSRKPQGSGRSRLAPRGPTASDKTQCSGAAAQVLRLPRPPSRMPDESGSSDEEVMRCWPESEAPPQ